MSEINVSSRPRPARVEPRHRFDWLVRRSVGDLPLDLRPRRLTRAAAVDELARLGPASPTLISSAHGTIEGLLLAIPSSAARDPVASSTFRELMYKLPRDTGLRVLTHASSLGLVRSWPEIVERGSRASVVAVRDHIAFSVWVEDPFAAVADTTTAATWLVEPYEFFRSADAIVADYVADGMELRFGPSTLYFQGGNILAGDDFFLIGEDYPRYMNDNYVPDVVTVPEGADPEVFIRDLYRDHLDQRRGVLYLGDDRELPAQRNVLRTFEDDVWTEEQFTGNVVGTRQPLFHIDMFVTLAGRDASGRYQLLVGDPRMATELLGQTLPENSLADSFDRIADALRAEGFDVRRNPLPLTYWYDRVSADYFEQTEPRITERLNELGLEEVDLVRWYYATSNNALVQISEEQGNVVWLPTYGEGFEATDLRNREIWQDDLQFEVRLLGDFHSFAQSLGAVHCISKYLSRR